jgi:beta-glucosidase
MRYRTLAVAMLAIFFTASASSAALAQVAASRSDVEKRVDSILSQMTLEEKLDYIGGINLFYTRAIPRLHIPAFRMSDGPMGVHDYGPTTAYPAGIALAASWDTDLARRVGASMGQDARARGVQFILAPGMNIYRAPMCSRNFEYFGEDPFLASRMAVGLIEGIQSQRVIATAKHFAANNQEFDRHNLSSDVDERTLREIYLPAFEASVKEAKVAAVMDSYNLINGVHATQNDRLNNQILKKEWGFDGILMSDWVATYDGVGAANGGLDLEMPFAAFMNRANLEPAIKDGRVSVATIDDKVRRILRKAVEFGFLDGPAIDPGIPLFSEPGRELVLQQAREGMVLLKNQGSLLPLDKTKLKNIAVIGPNAYPAIIGGGGSSQTAPFNSVSLIEGVSNYLGKDVNVLYTDVKPPLDEVFDHSQFSLTPGGEPGLKGEYFSNEDFKGEPVLIRTDEHVDFHWWEGSFIPNGPTEHFSIRWSGYFTPARTDEYSFYGSSVRGVRLYLDDQEAHDWQRQDIVSSQTVHLEGGHTYKLRVEYSEPSPYASVGFGVVGHQNFLDRAKAVAARADAVILAVGFSPASEHEEGDRTFKLPAGQDELIQQIAGANKNTIVVLTAGGNVDMNGWVDAVPALLHAWYSGQEGGAALAQIIFGDYSPSGKLPASFERRWEDNPTFHSYYPAPGEKAVKYTEGIFVGYRYYDHSTTKPRFPFGFGLSYTTFGYKNLSISPASGNLSQPVQVSFDLTNTGHRSGAEVAELYVGDSHAGVPRPVKELKGFARVELKPGETRRVVLTLDRRAFSYYDVGRKDWNADPGKFEVLVGSSSDKIQLQGGFNLER